MNFLHLPIPLFFILQLFTSIVWSQGAPSTVSASAYTSISSVASGSVSTPTTTTGQSTGTGTTNSTSLASSTSSAQFPSLSGVSTCVSNCLAQASANLNCTSVVDVNCFCNNTNYPAQLLNCVLENCSDQVSTIETLGQEFCNQASGQPTLSYSSVPITTASSTSSSTSTSTSTTPSSSTTTTNSAAKSMSGSTSLMELGAIMVLSVILGV